MLAQRHTWLTSILSAICVFAFTFGALPPDVDHAQPEDHVSIQGTLSHGSAYTTQHALPAVAPDPGFELAPTGEQTGRVGIGRGIHRPWSGMSPLAYSPSHSPP